MLQAADLTIRLHPNDDVVIARVEIPTGTVVAAEKVRAAARIPAGHKLAVRDIAAGRPVKRYDQIIGFATCAIKAGEHVHVHNLGMADFARDYSFCSDRKDTDYITPQAAFEGIVRADGRVATRNYIGILTSVNCSATVARMIADHFRKRGIKLQTQASVQSVKKDANGVTVDYKDKSGAAQIIAADCVLVAVGRRPFTDGLNLAAAGVELDEKKRIKVDGYLRTSAAGVWAIGDCNGLYQFTHMAEHEAGVCAKNIVRSRLLPFALERMHFRAVAWVTFTDPEVAHCGLTEAEAKERGIDHRVLRYDFDHLDRAVIEGQPVPFARLDALVKEKKFSKEDFEALRAKYEQLSAKLEAEFEAIGRQMAQDWAKKAGPEGEAILKAYRGK